MSTTKAVDFFSQKFPIITQYAIELIEKFIPEQYWQVWMEMYNILEENDRILDHTVLISTVDEIMHDKELSKRFIQTGNLVGLMEEYIRHRMEDILGQKLKTIAKELVKTGCSYESITKYEICPLTIYVNGKPKVFEQNSELIYILEMLMNEYVTGTNADGNLNYTKYEKILFNRGSTIREMYLTQ